MLVRIEPLPSFIAAPLVTGSVGATTILTRGDTRVHVLRHTLAERLLQGGGTLKEVADVLRHRELDTSLIYAKVDTNHLSAVALPWPGSAA